MRLALESVANREWRVFRGWQSIGRGKLGANVATRVAGHLGVVFEPEKEPLFELTTEWLPNMGRRTRLEAGNPPGNGATCNFEQIDACNSRCDHLCPSCKNDL